MSVFLVRGIGAAVLVVSAQGALADISAQDVWSDWKSYMTGTGYTVTGTETVSGNVLTVADITMTMPIPEEDATGGVTIPEIQFVENGDGTVNVLMPKEVPMTFMASGDGETVKGEIIYSHDGNPMKVSGDSSRMVYDYATSQLSMTLGKIEATGEEIPDDLVKLSLVMSDVVTKTDMSLAEMRSYTQIMTATGLTYDIAFKDPEGNGQGAMKGALNQLSFEGKSTIPSGLSAPDMAALINAGFGFEGGFTFGAGNSSMSVADRDETFGYEGSSQGGKFDMSMNKDHLSYDFNQTGMNINVSASEIPFPLALSMAETGFKLMMPIAKSEEEQEFALGVTLRDFAVPEMLWGMVDPMGALPHDPATIVVDLAGKGKLLFDLLDPAAMEAVDHGEQQPGELNALDIKQLLVSAAGAKLTGTGAFTFNNEDLVSFDGMPAPSGEANVQLVGANGLIDTLISMGLLSEQDAMGARMMMGMLAVPGEGEDTLNSKIEIKDGGQILANGQRLK